jgi:hypothetical protein
MSKLAVTFQYWDSHAGQLMTAHDVEFPRHWSVADAANNGFWVSRDTPTGDFRIEWQQSKLDSGDARWIPPARVVHVRRIADLIYAPVAEKVVACQQRLALDRRQCVLRDGHPGPHMFPDAHDASYRHPSGSTYDGHMDGHN